jgi:hypothetical protein
MTDVHVPSGWPEAVAPPGTQDWESSAVEYLLDLVPYLRGHTACRYPVILAAIARHVADGAAEGARDGYRIARTELGEAVPPHAVEAALAAYRDEGRRLVAAVRGAELIERALRGEALLARGRLLPVTRGTIPSREGNSTATRANLPVTGA